MNYRQWLAELYAALAEEAWKRYMANANQRLFIVADRGNVDGIFRNLRIETDASSADVVVNEHLPRCFTSYQLTRWVESRLRSQPIIDPAMWPTY